MKKKIAPTPRGLVSRISSWPAHPFLFALYPVAFLYRRNLDQVPWEDAAQVGLVVGGLAVALFVLSRLALRDQHRAGVAVSGIALIALSYGHARTVIADQRIGSFVVGSDGFLLPLWALLAIAILVIAARVKTSGREVTKLLNVVAFVLLVTSAFPAAVANVETVDRATLASGGIVQLDGRPKEATSAGSEKLRDIIYIVPDRYPGAAMKQQFRLDNGPFLRSLEERGFYVAREARANYPNTFFSLASTLNMDYLGKRLDSSREVYPLLEDNRVVRFLRSKGYRWVYFRSTHDPTRMRNYDDVTYQYKAGSAFSQTFFETTIAGTIAQHQGLSRGLEKRLVFRNTTLFQFRNLPRARNLGGPVFVFAHILLPHDPFVFEADGGLVTPEEEKTRSLTENYVNHVRYVNRQLDQLLDALLSDPPDQQPIILIQSDEGPHIVKRPGLSWATATRNELDRAFTTLAAYYTPGVDASKLLYPSISSANSFRALLDLYFDARLPLLPDKHYGWKRPPQDPDAYEFLDVSDHLGTGHKAKR